MNGPPAGEGLRAAAARLEEVARRIGDPDLPADELRALAEEALELGARITGQLPAALRPPAGEA